jgi:hypothetical protein
MATANEQVGQTGVRLTKGRNPSNTHGLQKALLRDLQRRLRQVRGAIRRTVGYENDALRLSANADPEASEGYDFPTLDGRAQAFLRDLRSWLRGVLLGDNNRRVDVRNGDHWIAEYIREAYQVGISNGEGRLLQVGVSLTPSEPADALRRPITQQQLSELYARAFEQLEDVTDAAARQLRQSLTGGLAEGANPRDIARRLNDDLQQIERSRLATIARTEIINSHADAAVAQYERHGADVVSHTSRLTAKDDDVCAFCRALDGVPFTLSEFQTVTVQWGTQPRRIGIPAHPNGRCSPMPEVGLSGDELPPLAERIPNEAGGRPITILST